MQTIHLVALGAFAYASLASVFLCCACMAGRGDRVEIDYDDESVLDDHAQSAA